MVSLILFIIFMILWFASLISPSLVLGRFAPFLSVLFLAIHALGIDKTGNL